MSAAANLTKSVQTDVYQTESLRQLIQQAADLMPKLAYWSIRLLRSDSESLSVRRDVVQPLRRQIDCGAMITLADAAGGVGYAATADLSLAGLQQAITCAQQWLDVSRERSLINAEMLKKSAEQSASRHYQTPLQEAWDSLSLADKIELLQQQNQHLSANNDSRIIDRQAALWYRSETGYYLTSTGHQSEQTFHYLLPGLSATAQQGSEIQTRSFGGHAHLQQGGLEVMQRSGFLAAARGVAEQALELLNAPNCPSEVLDVVLAPDQMILQIHESIGHPLELDRILGDERNYAGSSFVELAMFGDYRYGSELLNVTFDPTVAGECASYAFDHDGSAARRQYLIKQGILQQPLGGCLAQQRANIAGVANSRASSWNRPPIDRMANLNLEPGDSSFARMIEQIEYGVYMETNRSWSIDDTRNKFQFGCEWGRMIRQGRLAEVVKNPNYRGQSAQFWRSLAAVGDAASVQVLGTPYCGKGEPNQAIIVGHASPPCLFKQVAVFGGE